MTIHGPDSGEAFLIAAGVPKPDIEECLIWALGRDYKRLGIGEIPKRWNKLHGDIFVISGHDPVWKAITAIGMAWVDYIKPADDGKLRESGY